MAAAHQDTSSSSANSEGSQMKYKIDVKKKGLFVVIKQVTHNLHFPTNAAKDDWSEEKKELLNYGPDQEALKNLFDLKPSNYIGGTNLENGSGKGSFDGFMKKLCDSEEAEKPEFLMFFLMSHGLEDGKFLLAGKNKAKGKIGSEVSQEACCEGKELTEHTYGVVDGEVPTDDVKDVVNKCFARDIKHVIRQVCESKRFFGVPKVFFMQVCRGGKIKNLEGLSDPIPTSSDIELFIPDCLDTLVIRASTEGYISSVVSSKNPLDIPGGSLLLQSFSKAMKELQQSNDELEEVKRRSAGDVTRFLEEHREDLTGGWIMNVCQHTTALVTTYLNIRIISSAPSFKHLLSCGRAEFKKKISDSSKKDTCEELKKNLKGYANYLWEKILIADVTKFCEEKGSGYVQEIMRYLYCKLSGATPESLSVSDSTLQQVPELMRELDILIAKIQQESASSSQVAQIYNTLQERRATPDQIIQRLKDLSAEEKDKTLVEGIIALCEENGDDYTLDVVKYLRVNLARVEPVCYPESITRRGDLVEKLNTMIENIQLLSAYGKQQPHLSSSLCKRLSMIDILETQGKTTG